MKVNMYSAVSNGGPPCRVCHSERSEESFLSVILSAPFCHSERSEESSLTTRGKDPSVVPPSG